MKVNEIITEGAGLSKLRKGARDATPDLEAFPQLDNNNNPYLAYRFGVAMAVSPDTHMDREGPIGSEFTTIGYTDADREIIDGAKKLMGVQSNKKSSGKSKESDWVNKQSPMQPKGPVKRKNK
jgi:hypothetical protein